MENQDHPILKVNTKLYRLVLLVLVIIFAGYTGVVYTTNTETDLPPMTEQALKGQELWQKNNCTACHQFYGLGGYLGPDLTNIISTENKGPQYVKAFLNSGIKVMPKFDFTESEMEEIIAFLTHVDKTGFFPNKLAKLKNTGWVELKYKNPQDE